MIARAYEWSQGASGIVVVVVGKSRPPRRKIKGSRWGGGGDSIDINNDKNISSCIPTRPEWHFNQNIDAFLIVVVIVGRLNDWPKAVWGTHLSAFSISHHRLAIDCCGLIQERTRRELTELSKSQLTDDGGHFSLITASFRLSTLSIRLLLLSRVFYLHSPFVRIAVHLVVGKTIRPIILYPSRRSLCSTIKPPRGYFVWSLWDALHIVIPRRNVGSLCQILRIESDLSGEDSLISVFWKQFYTRKSFIARSPECK